MNQCEYCKNKNICELEDRVDCLEYLPIYAKCGNCNKVIELSDMVEGCCSAYCKDTLNNRISLKLIHNNKKLKYGTNKEDREKYMDEIEELELRLHGKYINIV